MTPDILFAIGAISLASTGITSWYTGRHCGRRQGYDHGRSAGFLEGRRTERAGLAAESVPPAPVASYTEARDVRSRTLLRIAAGISSAHVVRLTIDREGYVVALNVVKRLQSSFQITKMRCEPSAGWQDEIYRDRRSA